MLNIEVIASARFLNVPQNHVLKPDGCVHRGQLFVRMQ